jgi:hypothetical protein
MLPRKTQYVTLIKFTANNSSIGYDGKCIGESVNMKFLGLQIDNHLNLTNHIDKLIPKLSGACYAVRSVCHIINTDAVKSVYFAYFHSTMKYGIIFWGNSSNSKKIVTLQMENVRLMAGIKHRNSCRSMFKRLVILTLPCEYIFSLLLFIVNNQEHFQTNSTVYSVNTWNKISFIDQLSTYRVFKRVLIMLV